MRRKAVMILGLFGDAVVLANSNHNNIHKPTAGVIIWNDADWNDDGTAQIPLGNGHVTAGVWVVSNHNNNNSHTSSGGGDLRILVGSSSALDENRQPVHHGLLRITLDPPLFVPLNQQNHQQQQFSGRSSSNIRQTFDPYSASLLVKADRYSIRVYVDANAPILRVSIESTNNTKHEPFTAVATLEPYRRFQESNLGFQKCHSIYDHYDTILSPKQDKPHALQNTVTWYHENPTNATRIFEETMQHQGVDPHAWNLTNPFRGRIFGGSLYGSNMKLLVLQHGDNNDNNDDKNTQLVGTQHSAATIHVALHTAVPATAASWIQDMASLVASHPVEQQQQQHYLESAPWRQHVRVWKSLWDRSFVTLSSSYSRTENNSSHDNNNTEAKVLSMEDSINSHIVWDRYLTLIQGRKAETPIKFNGQAFVANNTDKGGWDYRQWGADYWWQNTRQPYYNALMQGDVEVLDSLLQFYQNMLPYCQARTFSQFQHDDRPLPKDGCFYPETTTAFGTYAAYAWGCEGPVIRPDGAAESGWIRYHWTGNLELSLLLLDRFEWTGDTAALQDHVSILQSVLAAFMHRFSIVNGSIDMFPAQSLETWQCADPRNRSDCVTNPTPDIAGLRAVLKRATRLPEGIVSKEQQQVWNSYYNALPRLPTKILDNGAMVIMPGERLPPKAINKENTELYTVHPFRLFSVGKTNLELAQATYRHRRFPCNQGWCQDIVDAAMLNVTADLVSQVEERVSSGSAKGFRFPGFAAHFQDYEPSLDHFATLRTAINYMLLSPLDDGSGQVVLFPGFPQNVWNVEFKLCGPNNTVIQAACHGGDLSYLRVDPPEEAWRVKDTGNCRNVSESTMVMTS